MGKSSASSAGLLALLAAGTLGCEEAPLPSRFDIHFQLDDGEGGLCGKGTTCEDYGLSCGAKLMVRVWDIETGTKIPLAQCADVEPSSQICDLEPIEPITALNLPLRPVRFEVAAWNPEDLVDGQCPQLEFDATGRPRVNFQPRPALAGSRYFDVSLPDTDIWIPLQCTDVGRLDASECSAQPSTRLTAQVDELSLGNPITDDAAEELSVRVAPPRAVGEPGGGQRIDIDDYIDLPRVEDGPPPPTFTSEVDGTMSGRVCTVVLDAGPQETASATCRDLGSGGGDVQLRGVLVTRETLQPLVDAMGTEFPETGLVVGRVLDHTGAPLAGVSVRPGTGRVEYLDEAGTGLVTTGTSSRGYFLSRDAPFGTVWSATHPDGRAQETRPVAGLVHEMVTPVLIRMQELEAPEDPEDPEPEQPIDTQKASENPAPISFPPARSAPPIRSSTDARVKW